MAGLMGNKTSLRGKVVAITGGGRGIGLATAKLLVGQGAKVSIGDIDLEVAQEQAQRINAFAAKVDVRDKDSFADFLEATRTALGPVDVLINNAGIMPMGGFLEETDALSDTQIDINLRGVINGMKLALPEMLERGSGHIVNVASLAGRFAIPGASVYTATKFAVVGLTDAVRQEYRDTGVHFSTVMPSKVLTDLASGTDEGKLIPAVPPEAVADAIVDAIRKQIPEVTAPRYMVAVPGLYNLTPDWLTTRLRRLIKDDRILTKLDHSARSDYSQRLQGLAKVAKKKAASRKKAATQQKAKA